MSLPGPVDHPAAGPLLPAGTAGAAEREQERSRRRRPRGYTFSMFHSPGGADHMDARGHVQSSQPPPWTPIVPIHNVCPLPGEGRPWCPEQEAPAGTTGRPSSSPRGARKRSPATLGERSSRGLHGRPPGGHGSRSSAQDSADGFPAGRAAPIPGAPGVPSILLGLRSGKDGVRVEALCFAGVRHGYIYVKITKPTDWWLLWRG